jgi:hypothetical protein
MNGILVIYPIDAVQDWQRLGFKGNKDFAIKKVNTIKLHPFFHDYVTSGVVSEFKVQKISQKSIRNEVIIIDTINITTGAIDVTTGTFSKRFTYYGQTSVSGLSQGYWQFYFKLSDGLEFFSELMYVPAASDMIETLPDFNEDFNNDYLV